MYILSSILGLIEVIFICLLSYKAFSEFLLYLKGKNETITIKAKDECDMTLEEKREKQNPVLQVGRGVVIKDIITVLCFLFLKCYFCFSFFILLLFPFLYFSFFLSILLLERELLCTKTFSKVKIFFSQKSPPRLYFKYIPQISLSFCISNLITPPS